MVRIEHKRALFIFRFGDKKFEWPIETRYWRNPLLGIACLALLPLCFLWQPDIMSLIATANIYACIAIPLAWQMTGICRMNFGPQVFVGIGGFTAALLSVQDALREKGGEAKIAATNATNRKIFEITRLDQHLEIFDSVIDAVKSLH